jgi:hypothetical protein
MLLCTSSCDLCDSHSSFHLGLQRMRARALRWQRRMGRLAQRRRRDHSRCDDHGWRHNGRRCAIACCFKCPLISRCLPSPKQEQLAVSTVCAMPSVLPALLWRRPTTLSSSGGMQQLSPFKTACPHNPPQVLNRPQYGQPGLLQARFPITGALPQRQRVNRLTCIPIAVTTQ